MRRMVIAEGNKEAAQLLADKFHSAYDVTVCSDGQMLIHLLHSTSPDILILDLSLPVRNGLYILRRAADALPPVILAICTYPDDKTVGEAMELGVGAVMIRPYQFRALQDKLEELIWYAEHPGKSVLSPQALTLRHLLHLCVPPGNDGFHQLRIGIPLYAQAPGMAMEKELYRDICLRLGGGDTRAVERNIRSAIKIAWQRRKPAVWHRYFPDCQEKPPGNREFIATLALMVEMEQKGSISVRPFSCQIETPH